MIWLNRKTNDEVRRVSAARLQLPPACGMTHTGPHHPLEWVCYTSFLAVFFTGIGYLIRDIRRRHSLAQLTLLALTTAYLAIGLFCLIAFYDGPNRGYYVTAVAYPFYVLLAICLIRHRPADE